MTLTLLTVLVLSMAALASALDSYDERSEALYLAAVTAEAEEVLKETK